MHHTALSNPILPCSNPYYPIYLITALPFSLLQEEEEEEREGRPRQQRVKKAARGNQRRRRDGPTSDQIDEVTAMFGEDYGDFEDDEEEEEEEGDGTIKISFSSL